MKQVTFFTKPDCTLCRAALHVVRVPADPFSKWIFTTSLKDRERYARLAEERPDLSLLDQVRLLAAEG